MTRISAMGEPEPVSGPEVEGYIPNRCSSSLFLRSSSFLALSLILRLSYFALLASRSFSLRICSLVLTASALLASLAFFRQRAHMNS